jgi:hypothetical protein
MPHLTFMMTLYGPKQAFPEGFPAFPVLDSRTRQGMAEIMHNGLAPDSPMFRIVGRVTFCPAA